MHLLSTRNRSEFLATPELIRFTLAEGKNGPEPTLLIKTTTLALKYLIRLKRFRLLLFRIQSKWVGYGIRIDDDPDHPGTLWSLFEYSDELAGATGLENNSKCTIFLFNELALNVAWGEAEIKISKKASHYFLKDFELHDHKNSLSLDNEVSHTIESLQDETLEPTKGMQLDWSDVEDWHPIENHYITNRSDSSLISIFEIDEGRQQEEIARWLMDNLAPTGAIHSPQIYEESKVRELSDILLSYENGCFLIESKTLSIFTRNRLPSRKKLADDVKKHLKKAVGQLVGGVKNLRRGLRITDVFGDDLKITNKASPHIIVLVPDLNLLWDALEFNGDFFKVKCVECNGYLHILDPAELLRMVQAADMISKRDKSKKPIVAFDHYLIKRAKLSWKQKTPDFSMLLRFQNDG